MKILCLSDLWLPYPGGAERFAWNISHNLKSLGHEVQVLTSYEKAIPYGDIPVTWKNIGCRANNRHAQGWTCIQDSLNEYRPDMIFVHQFFADEFKEELAFLTIPIVQIVHAEPRFSYAALAIFNSKFTLVRNADPNIDTSKGICVRRHTDLVIHPPVDDDVISSWHGNAIGFVKPVKYKGVEFFHQIAEQMPERKFVVLRGEWWHFDDIRERPNTEYLAPLDCMKDFYRRCRLILVPSEWEDAGTIPQEAAANRIPCISTDVGGLPETNGGIILPKDVDLWKAEINKLDDRRYYDQIVAQQWEHLTSFRWPERFQELDRKIRILC